MKKIQKALSGLLAGLMLFTSVPVSALPSIVSDSNIESIISTEEENNPEIETNAISTNETAETDFNNTEETLDSSKETEDLTTETPVIEDKPTVFLDGEEDLEETDNWELGVVFYDSTVENGTKPLTEINWDASDGGYDKGTPRVITVQINYKNTNTVTTYQPGELEISIPNIVYSNHYISGTAYDALWSTEINPGANDSSHTGYPWNFGSGKYAPSTSSQYYYFYNAETIEEKANCEGSIQIKYTITPKKDGRMDTEHTDSCTHSYSIDLKATLNANESEIIETSNISLNYFREYIHPWENPTYIVKQTPSKIKAYDGLPAGAENYTWVKYSYEAHYDSGRVDMDDGWNYPYACAQNFQMENTFPEGCIICDMDGTILNTENNLINIKYNTAKYDSMSYGKIVGYLYVGYPKSIYNEKNGNMIIDNTVNLTGKYVNKTEVSLLDDDTVSINLNDFKFEYTGDLYGIVKDGYTYQEIGGSFYSTGDLMYQEIITNSSKNFIQYYIEPNTRYTGTKLTVRAGDDLIYATNNDGEYEKLTDDDYYFSFVSIPAIKNQNGNVINKDKYNITLFVRFKGENKYVQYGESFKNTDELPWYGSIYTNTSGDTIINFKDSEKVVGWYVQIDDMEEGISQFPIKSKLHFIKKDIPESGEIFNFCYLQVFGKDDNNNLILLNAPEEDSYASFITKEIAKYDIDTYGTYMQRTFKKKNWSVYIMRDFSNVLALQKEASKVTQNALDKVFTGNFRLSICPGSIKIDGNVSTEEFFNQLDKKRFYKDFVIYDLLPRGMELTSSAEDIINSIDIYPKNSSIDWKDFFNESGKQAFTSKEETLNFFKERTTVTIKQNWENTGRTYLKISVDFQDYPLFVMGSTMSTGIVPAANGPFATFFYDYAITYEDYIENGSVYENYMYVDSSTSATDDFYGSVIQDYNDINENGDFKEYLICTTDTVVIDSVVSTHQSLQTQVSSTLSNYSTGTVPAEYNKDYSYRLRVSVGKNDVTNLIIYDNLEKWVKDQNGNFAESFGNKKYWQGEFQGVDTSYAESKGYTVKVWYSENEKAGTLAEDSSWKEYIWPTLVPDLEKAVTITSPNWPNDYPPDMWVVNDYWEQSFDGADAIQITFDSTSKLESAEKDFLCFYDKKGNNITNDLFGITAGRIGGSDLAGKTVTVPGDYVKIAMTSDKYYQYKGFSAQLCPMKYEPVIENSKIKSLAFQYLDAEGNPAVLPANSLTYVVINMKAPADESITTFAYNGCWTQWNALDEFGQPVDFITGINSNIVKVALPNSVDSDSIPSIELDITKEIQGTNDDFENLKLDPNAEYNFQITLEKQEANEDGSHDIVHGLLSNKKGLTIKGLTVGSWLISEADDNYFDFVDIVSTMDPDIEVKGVTFEKTDAGYLLTITEDLDPDIDTIYSLKVINKIEPERHYEETDSEINLFNATPVVEEQSLLQKFFSLFE